MNTNNLSKKLVTELHSNRDILQSFAFESLMNQVWGIDKLNPRAGAPLLNDLACIDELMELMGKASPVLQNKIAWLLGALVEVDSRDLGVDTRQKIKAGISEYLSIIQNILKRDDSYSEIKEIEGFIFLLGHFPEDALLISEKLSEYLGQDAYKGTHLDLIFSLMESYPARGQFLLAHQGAKACNQACDSRISVFKNVLACPECHGALDYSEDVINCHECHAEYQWFFDAPSLIPQNCDDPEEYPESLVKIYETESRPRFVRVMGQDWSSLITKDRERDYLNQFLHPVDGPVLDLACGVGNSTQLLIDMFGPKRIIAIDYSAAMVQYCENSIKGATVVRGSASALPIVSDSLGAVNCSDALQALPDPQQAIMEVARCMLPGAIFTGFTFLEASWPYSYFQNRLHYAKRHLFTLTEIKEFLENSNLVVIDFTVIERALFFTAKKSL